MLSNIKRNLINFLKKGKVSEVKADTCRAGANPGVAIDHSSKVHQWRCMGHFFEEARQVVGGGVVGHIRSPSLSRSLDRSRAHLEQISIFFCLIF